MRVGPIATDLARGVVVTCSLLAACTNGQDPPGSPTRPLPSAASAVSGSAAASAASAVAPEPGRVQLELAPNRSSLFAMVPSISVDEAWLAAVVTEADSDGNVYWDQELVIRRAPSDEVERSFVLSDVHRDGSFQAIKRGELESVRVAYQKRADEANAWLATKTWRALVSCEAPLGACKAELDEPHFRIASPTQVLLDEARPAWSHAPLDPHCRSVNRALLSRVDCDPASTLALVEIAFLGGHDGCVAPLPVTHVVDLKVVAGCGR